MTECVQRITPYLNTLRHFSLQTIYLIMVIQIHLMSKGQTRKSIAVYYYTNGRLSEEAHSLYFVSGKTYERIPRLDLTPKVLIKKNWFPLFSLT